MPNKTDVSSPVSAHHRQQGHVRAMFGPMDIKMPPIKMHMLSGHMVPSLGSTMRFLKQKHRLVALEIIEPFDDGANQLTVAWDPENEMLHDKDQVVLRFFRKRKQKQFFMKKQKKMFGLGGHDDQSEDDDDDGM